GETLVSALRNEGATVLDQQIEVPAGLEVQVRLQPQDLQHVRVALEQEQDRFLDAVDLQIRIVGQGPLLGLPAFERTQADDVSRRWNAHRRVVEIAFLRVEVVRVRSHLCDEDQMIFQHEVVVEIELLEQVVQHS